MDREHLGRWSTGRQYGNVTITYDVIANVVTHMPAYNSGPGPTDYIANYVTDPGNYGALKRVAIYGDSVAIPVMGSSGATRLVYLNYQTNNQFVPSANVTFQATGKLVTSLYDYATPSIPKLLRRVTIQHRPLKAGEKIQADAYLDKDPLTQTLGSPDFTVSNTTLASTQTVLIFSNDTLARSAFYVFTLTAGTSNLTTPVIFRWATEIGSTWVWDLELDASARRRIRSSGRNAVSHKYRSNSWL